MKKLVAVVSVLIVVGLLLFVTFGDRNSDKGTPDITGSETPPLRVAWMTSWATTGQVVESLIHTDILAQTGTKAEFRSFLFGPPMNEAALAKDVDVTIVGDVPAISLLARSPDWSVVSRTIYFPYALMVRTDIEAETIADLRGKTVGVPFGSGPQPTLYRWLEESGLVIGDTVNVINLLPNEMAEGINAKRVDAIMTWEPTITLMKQTGAAKVLRPAVGVGFMVMANDYLEKHPDNAKRFLEAWKEALLYTARNPAETDAWFHEDSRMPIELLAELEVVDSNLSATVLSEIDIELTAEDVAKNQTKADFMFEQKLISSPLNIASRLWRSAAGK